MWCWWRIRDSNRSQRLLFVSAALLLLTGPDCTLDRTTNWTSLSCSDRHRERRITHCRRRHPGLLVGEQLARIVLRRLCGHQPHLIILYRPAAGSIFPGWLKEPLSPGGRPLLKGGGTARHYLELPGFHHPGSSVPVGPAKALPRFRNFSCPRRCPSTR